jgi:diguanylate cyclase
MARVTIVQTDEKLGQRFLDLTLRDWGGVGLVAALSTVMSVLTTLAFGGRGMVQVGPAVVIPLIVSIPASVMVFRQRRAMADLNAQMLHLLQRDPLTGLLSRRFFLAAAEAEARRGGALLLIDADRFKGINDRFGHPAGDAVLVALAERFHAAAGDDVLIGRLGGEEFAAFAPGQDMGRGRAIGEAIRARVRAGPVLADEAEIAVSVSVGLAMLPPGGALAEAIRAADEALYRAKALGRDRVVAVGEEAAEAVGPERRAPEVPEGR